MTTTTTMPTAMTSTDSTPPITLYDIKFCPPVAKNTCAPNPWKARYALNFKNANYTTQWVAMPDIANVRRAVGAPAGRKFADGTDFYTLPLLTDSTTGVIVGDSFDIAVHLQRVYPDAGAGDLFPDQSLDFGCPEQAELLIPLSKRADNAYENYARFNTQIDGLFTMHVGLTVHGMPFDPETAAETHAEFVRRAGVSSWADFEIHGAQRTALKTALREALAPLAGLFQRDSSGPFVLGQRASYADLIVGAWLRMLHRTLPADEWEEIAGWHEGTFGALHEALDRFATVK
ncbi:hypothetical protein N7462_006225 [Penicillium macrosclerotiorum]|uniref:uncharacterized protein n=1 Tax=Penicillium macrosclerotiorum TaxID=303699 RepID=UPI002547CA37|nr:uncharacterized protein N7462_006225 [Penicillium macrosclerotiorum]KAJ5683060.1 hypothetical protein N7462_006225 [Penicillium macrosclerotiorum]